MTQGDDRGKDRTPGGGAAQRRRAFLEQRGLPLDDDEDEPEDEATPEEEGEQPADGEDPGGEDGTTDENDG